MAELPDAVRNRTLDVFERELEIALLEGETVLYEGRPQAAPLRAYLALGWTGLTALTVIGLPLLPLVWWASRAFVRRHRYWLTSKRVVVTTGVIGYRARSVPLERISDVGISCNWLERLLGIRSVVVRDMTGEAQSGAAMLAVADATELQRKILELVHDANHSTREPPRSLTAPYREEGPLVRALLDVLQRIEENTRKP